MQITTALGEAIGKYLNLETQQMKLTASNIANADTPGYKTQGIDMESEFAKQLSSRLSDQMINLPSLEVGGLVTRPDGNNVSLDREGMQLAKSQLQFRMGIELLKHQFGTVMSAIHAETK